MATESKGEFSEVHTWEVSELVRKLNTNVDTGLNAAQVQQRLEEYGENRTENSSNNSVIVKFIRAVFLGDWIQIVGGAVVTLGVVLSLVLPLYYLLILPGLVIPVILFRAYGIASEEQTIRSLKELGHSATIVIRDGQKIEVESEQLVPGDVVFLSLGESIPADIRWIEKLGDPSSEHSVDMSMLTGEPDPKPVSVEAVKDASMRLLDSPNIGLYSCLVLNGKLKGIVFATGRETLVYELILSKLPAT